MNSNNVENILDEYYNTFLERNDMSQIVITPDYVEQHREQMEKMVTLFTLYPDYLIDVITPGDSFFKLYFYQRFHILTLLFQKNDYLLEKSKILHNQNKFQSKNQINL